MLWRASLQMHKTSCVLFSPHKRPQELLIVSVRAVLPIGVIVIALNFGHVHSTINIAQHETTWKKEKNKGPFSVVLAATAVSFIGSPAVAYFAALFVYSEYTIVFSDKSRINMI